MIVEIVSPENLIRDREVKYREYEAALVPEYWLIDAERRRGEFFRLGAAGQYHPVPPDEQGIFHSEAFPGFWLKTDWLWQDPLPDENDVLGELGVL